MWQPWLAQVPVVFLTVPCMMHMWPHELDEIPVKTYRRLGVVCGREEGITQTHHPRVLLAHVTIGVPRERGTKSREAKYTQVPPPVWRQSRPCHCPCSLENGGREITRSGCFHHGPWRATYWVANVSRSRHTGSLPQGHPLVIALSLHRSCSICNTAKLQACCRCRFPRVRIRAHDPRR